MAGPKPSSSLPAKKPKAKAAKLATAAKPSLSSEFVVDSDESGDAKTARVKKPASETAKVKSKSGKPAAPKPSKNRKSASPSPAKDDSSISGSSNDSDSQDEKRPAKKKILIAQDGSPTPKPKPATARPVLATPSIKTSTNVKPFDQKILRGPGAAGNKSKSEAGGSSEDGSTGSESGSESESESGSSDKTSLQSPSKESLVQKSVPQQPKPTYEPPTGFESTSISLHPPSKRSEILAPSNLQGKQLWHVTAPESVPISLVKEVSKKNFGNGASILDYHGARYGLVPESEVEQASSQALLLPSIQTNDYRRSKSTIIKTLHLQQLVSLPNHALEPAVHPNRSASASESYRKMPRQQPEGLRMRYRPFGVSDDSDLESTSKLMSKAPEFRIPAPVKESSPGRKRKRPNSNDGNSNVGSAVKSKKRKQSPQATSGAIEDPMDINGISDKRSNGVESPTKSSHPEINGVCSIGNLPNGNETKEERRKRREKKKLEQRESPSKPATALPLDVKQDVETMQPGKVVKGVSAVPNVVEGIKSINDISPQKESKDEKAKRRAEKRRRKDMERASRGASLISAEDGSQREVADSTSQDQMMQEIENAQRDASIQISTPKDNSPEKQLRTVQGSQSSTLDSSRISQREKTKEERAKRKEEKRRRKMESGSA